LDLYGRTLRVRIVEEVIAGAYAEQEMRCPVHLSIGQEAVAAGVCAALAKTDLIMSTHRSHGHYLAKGGNLKAMMAEIYGKAAGCAQGKGGSMHLVDLASGYLGSTPIVGATIPIAVGAAFGILLREEKRLVVVFLGEGATEEGVFSESVNFAALKNLPIVFVCENNLYSVYSPLSVRQPEGRRIHKLAESYGLEGRHGDGNDVEEVHRIARWAVDKARQGGGPSLLEFATYRWLEHCGPNYDNHIGYRTEAEFQKWKAADPVERMRKRLMGEKILTASADEAMRLEIDQEIKSAIAYAKDCPFPEASTLQEHVYSAAHA